MKSNVYLAVACSLICLTVAAAFPYLHMLQSPESVSLKELSASCGGDCALIALFSSAFYALAAAAFLLFSISLFLFCSKKNRGFSTLPRSQDAPRPEKKKFRVFGVLAAAAGSCGSVALYSADHTLAAAVCFVCGTTAYALLDLSDGM